ncbi:uncharacterized protein EI90DRAFT_3155493 [Cantharellus anzutake]|uniref:uncharacterized protein n=1 Tax=Cantharellus anzutake TaxID=1750568 RepID=UPI0019049A00|nr:uncharacterized protein EI90DRAFT_3155493 [Cantharellus anzutake]KAF8329127.1 hypothetical protein EI90DRAFT_3155493 [Cantharellus anzutake]
MHVAKSRVDKPGGMKFKVASKPQRRSVALSDVSKASVSRQGTVVPLDSSPVKGLPHLLDLDHGVDGQEILNCIDSASSQASIPGMGKVGGGNTQNQNPFIAPPGATPILGSISISRPSASSSHPPKSDTVAPRGQSTAITTFPHVTPASARADPGTSVSVSPEQRTTPARNSRKHKVPQPMLNNPSLSPATGSSAGEERPSKPVRRGIATRKRRPKTAEEIAAEDREAEEREPPDPTQITMSQLVRDMPVGRSAPGRSEKIQRLEETRRRNRELRTSLRERDRRLTMGLPRDPEDDSLNVPETMAPPLTESNDASVGVVGGPSEPILERDDDMDFINRLPGHAIVPRMMMDEHGRIAVDERSMTYTRPDVVPDDSMRHITERESDRFVNSQSHSRRNKGGQRWSKIETAEFYRWLSMFYMDFESIARVMPGRTRADIKRKFKAEDKRNSQLIDMYLKNQVPIDLDEYSRITGKDITGPVPVVSIPSKPASSNVSNIVEGMGPANLGEADKEGDKDVMEADLAVGNEVRSMVTMVTPAVLGGAPIPIQVGRPSR